MIPDLSNLRNIIDIDNLPDFSSLGINPSNFPTIDPESIQQMPAPAPTTGGIPGSDWWKEAGYPDAATAIMSGNFRYDMNTGWQLKPGATTPEQAFVAPPGVIQSAIENLPVTIGAMTSPTLGPLGTSGMSIMEGEPMTMDTDIDRAIARALASGRDMPMQVADDPVMSAVETAVGNGQPTTDDTILDTNDLGEPLPPGTDNGIDMSEFLGSREETLKTLQAMFGPQVQYATPTTATTDSGGLLGRTYTDEEREALGLSSDSSGLFNKGTETQQPDFMTQLQELIAQMQGEQTAAAEQAAAAEAERQKQAAEMTQNYMVGQPAVGYNPYESGQYQNNPYGSAGVPDMGGITSIPVPAAYQPYQPPGGAT